MRKRDRKLYNTIHGLHILCEHWTHSPRKSDHASGSVHHPVSHSLATWLTVRFDSNAAIPATASRSSVDSHLSNSPATVSKTQSSDTKLQNSDDLGDKDDTYVARLTCVDLRQNAASAIRRL